MSSLIKEHLQSQQEEQINGISVVAHCLLITALLVIWLYTLSTDPMVGWLALISVILCLLAYVTAYRKDYHSKKQGRWLNIAKLWGFMGALFGYLALKFSNEAGFEKETSILWPMAVVCLLLAGLAVLAEGFIPNVKPMHSQSVQDDINS